MLINGNFSMPYFFYVVWEIFIVVDANRLAALQTWESHWSCVIAFSVLFSHQDRTLHYIHSQYASFMAEKVNQTGLVIS
jgi:hypothetical protein